MSRVALAGKDERTMAAKGKHPPNTILRRLREERGWSLQRVADELRQIAETENENRIPGVNANMVGVWERGWKRPSPFYQAIFCQLYDRSAAQLGFVRDDALLLVLSEATRQEATRPTHAITQLPQLALASEQTLAIDLLCRATETTPEQQAGAWLTLGASGVGQLLHEGWTLDEALTSLQVVLQGIHGMPAINRRQLLQLGSIAVMSGIPMPVGERVSEEERVQFTNALGESICAGWKLFHTAGNAQVLAVGQSLLFLVQQNRAILHSCDRLLFYTGIYNLVGKALSFQAYNEHALQAHNSAYLAALQAGSSWHMIQSLICQADGYQAPGQHAKAIQTIEEALRIVGDHLTDEAHLRSKAHLLACWADNAITMGETAVAQKKLDVSATFLEHIGANEEFDHASWLQFAGKYAFIAGDYAKTIEYYEQALVELPENWAIRRALILIPTLVAYACKREREACLMTTEQAVSALHIVNAPTLNTQFTDAVNQALPGAFPNDKQVQNFINDKLHGLIRQ